MKSGRYRLQYNIQMNKKVLTAIAIIVLLLIGAGAFLMFSKGKPSTSSMPLNTQSGNSQKSVQSGPKSLKDLLLAGVPQKCTFSDVSEGVSMEGTTYIAGGKMRGDFSTTVEGTVTTGHSIYDGKASYVWMDGTPTGFKMEIDPNETATSETSTQGGLDLNKTIDYSCGVWVPDQTLFFPPDNVTFSAFNVPAPSEDSGSENQNLCATCDALTGEQKTQCLTTLNCN